MNHQIEEELWRIYSFYSLHGDPNAPEILRPAHFIKFCRDAQILSKKLTPTLIELEVTRLARAKAIGTPNDFNNISSITLTFDDFLQLIQVLAQKIYSKDSTEIAIKRLLLENILLLNNRRFPTNELYDLNDVDANIVIKETFHKGLSNIFQYYLDLAQKRRNQLLTSEKMITKDLRALSHEEISHNNNNSSSSLIVQYHLQQIDYYKELIRVNKDLISYKEFIQFCHDFNLKSTSLLSAIQVGDIFLNLIPISSFEKNGKYYELGMSFELFCVSLIYMACVAYREVDERVSIANKVRGLLLYMWKAVNDNEKTARLVASNRSNTLNHFAGSLNVYGCGCFSDLFLVNWLKDEFVDYTMFVEEEGIKSGSTMLKKVVGESKDYEKETFNSSTFNDLLNSNATIEEKEVLASNNNTNNTPFEGDLPKKQRTNSVFIQHYQHNINNLRPINATTSNQPKATFQKRILSQDQLELTSKDLQLLFQQRPELSEFLFIEIQNLKLETTNVLNQTNIFNAHLFS